ncbi:hypothetical protein Tco_0591151 [Tanacetum coccineum]
MAVRSGCRIAAVRELSPLSKIHVGVGGMEATGGDGDSVRSALFRAVLRVRRGGKETMGGGIVGGAYDGSMYDSGEGRRVDGGDDDLAGGEVLGALDRIKVTLF